MAAATETKGFIGAGDVYISRFDQTTGLFEPYQGPFETSKFEIGASADLKEQISKGRFTYGQVTAAASIPKPVDFNVDFAQIDKTTMAIALQGSGAVVTNAVQTITDQPITASLDAWVQTPFTNIDPVAFSVKDTLGTDTFVLGTDYEMNFEMGLFKALSGGAITAAESVKITGATLAVTAVVISGATDPQIRAKFLFDGINFVDGQPTKVECFDALVSSSAAFDFLASDFNKASLKGRLVTPPGGATPFQVTLKQTG
jgi:hypothetical protein